MNEASLNELRASLPGCELALLVDVATGTPLLASGIIDHGQEELDVICALAVTYLVEWGQTFCFLAHQTGHRVFLRAGPMQAEALCLLFAPDANMSRVAVEGQRFLKSDGQERRYG